MCGLIGGAVPVAEVERVIPSLDHRGPDATGVVEVDGWTLGHVRLAILDLDHRSDQPMRRGQVTVTFNGEAWNYRDLAPDCPALVTGSDTEVVAWTLDRLDPGPGLRALNGMFALAWTTGSGSVFLARDRYGEIPLHYGRRPDGGWCWASELHALLSLGVVPRSVRWVLPGELVEITAAGDLTRSTWTEEPLEPREGSPDRIRALLGDACRDRAMSDVPVACLLSGGIDSSAVGWHLVQEIPDLVFYTAVHDQQSPDLRAAREVAEMLGRPLVEVEVKAPTADDLAATVAVIEQPHKAQVEIAWPCLALAQELHADGVKVVLSGEGSDELWASYGMSYHGIQKLGWDGYRRDTFMGQHRKNFARCNKVFMRYGIECRLPFLHPQLVSEVLSWTRESVEFQPEWAKRPVPKAVLGAAYEGRLPDRVIRRPKLAFQTAAGTDRAAADAVAAPLKFYRNEFARQFRGVAA